MLPFRLPSVLPWLLIPIALLLALLGPRQIFQHRFSSLILSPDQVQPAPAAVVFGAGLTESGQPSTVLMDRILTAVDLYQSGRIDLLIMSGSTREPDYDEPAAMSRFAQRMGVPQNAILQDPEGVRTLASCEQVRDTFHLDRAILVTQQYHLPRALALCEGLGVQVQGVSADRRVYRALDFWNLREIPAAWMAIWDLTSLTARFPEILFSDG